MLHFVREHKSSWIIYFILGVVCFVFVFFGVEAVVSGPGVTAVATVGETPIEQLEVMRAEFNLVQAYRNAYKDQFTDELRNSLNLRRQALDGLIDRAVLAEQAQAIGLDISDDELRDVILGTPGFQRNGRFDKDQYVRTPAKLEPDPGGLRRIHSPGSLDPAPSSRSFRMERASARPKRVTPFSRRPRPGPSPT